MDDLDREIEEAARAARRSPMPRLLGRIRFAPALLLATLSMGCHTQYVPYDTGSGNRGYYITCGNKFERCESQAKDLCPDGFETVSSTHRSKLDTPMLLVKAETEYSLKIECDEPPTDAASGQSAPSGASNAP